MSLYNIRVGLIKLQSSRCPWWAGNCLSCVRSLRSYNWDAIDCAGRSWCSVWFGLYLILSNTSSSLSSSSWSNSGRSGWQKPLRLLRRRNASARWRSVAVMNPLHAGDAYVSRATTTARKTACRPSSVIPWCRNTRSAYKVWALSLMTWRSMACHRRQKSPTFNQSTKLTINEWKLQSINTLLI